MLSFAEKCFADGSIAVKQTETVRTFAATPQERSVTMELTANRIEELVKKIAAEMAGGVLEVPTSDGIPVGVSNRHIHLSREHVDILFGKGYQLEKLKDLSQPGQYACKETLTIIGPSLRPIERVRVLGPERRSSQVEISRTDAFTLKVKAPVRESGNIAGSAGISIVGPMGVVKLDEGCIIANRHIHMAPADASRFGVADGDFVTVDAMGERRTRFYDVQVRVSDAFALEMHVDTDDANAVGLSGKSTVTIVKE